MKDVHPCMSCYWIANTYEECHKAGGVRGERGVGGMLGTGEVLTGVW